MEDVNVQIVYAGDSAVLDGGVEGLADSLCNSEPLQQCISIVHSRLNDPSSICMSIAYTRHYQNLYLKYR